MKVVISVGNSKMGRIPNISLPPITTCRSDVLCGGDCYAMKSYRIYPSVREAWDYNLIIYQKSSKEYWDKIHEYARRWHPERFRFHVGGDFPDRYYPKYLAALAEKTPRTRYLVFTKRYSWVPSDLPENLSVVHSVWPGMKLPRRKGPRAWLTSDPRLPVEYYKCSGSCTECDRCWDLARLGLDVAFDLH